MPAHTVESGNGADPRPKYADRASPDDPASLRLALEATDARLARLIAGPGTAPAPTVVPKDQSARPITFHTAATALEDIPFIRAFHQAAKAEGIGVTVQTLDLIGDLATQLGPEIACIQGLVSSQWSEDSGHFHADGSVSYLARIGDDRFVRRAISNGRVQRLPAGFRDFPASGHTDANGAQRNKLALASAGARTVREHGSHVEGGNLIHGVDARGNAYALVGQDSMALSAAWLSHQLQRTVDEAETRSVVADDLGIDPRAVHAIEQPADFHLDMSMVALAPGQIVLHDSQLAHDLQARWLRADHAANKPSARRFFGLAASSRGQRALDAWERRGREIDAQIATLADRAATRARLEARAAADLQRAGMRVHRLAARFFDPARPDAEQMNFVNGETGIGATGHTFFITQGGDPRAEAHVAAELLGNPALGLDRLYLLPRSLSAQTLASNGATGCRFKAEISNRAA